MAQSAINGLDPEIASLIVAQQMEIHNQIAMAVQAKMAEAMNQQGETALRLLDAAVGVNKTPGSGERFDATA